MRRFRYHELRAALLWAAEGHQALYLYRAIDVRVADLFDLHITRLRATAVRLGAPSEIVQTGTTEQHIYLSGESLRRALAECEHA